MARMMQAASRERPMCGCTRCDKGGKIKRRNRRTQRAREAAALRRGGEY